MTGAATTLRALHEQIAALASAPDTTHGVRAVLDGLRVAVGAARLELRVDGPAGAETWISDAGPAGASPTVDSPSPVLRRTFPLVSPGGVPHAPDAPDAQVRGSLTADGAAADPDSLALVAATLDLLAFALAREARLQALEREITARVREIAEQRAFIECVVDSLPVGLYVVDRHYRIHAWNHKRETGLQGVSRTDALGRTIFEVLHRQPAALLKREFDEVFASGRLQQFQMDSSAFGEMRSYRISKIPMRMGGGEVSHVITIGEDITEWRAAIDRTAQSEKLAALGQLAAGVMHEINNPLATISACAESLALQRELAAAGAGAASAGSGADELLRIIDLEVARCKKIVNGLLDFSRPKPASREPLALNGVVEQGLFLLQHHPKYKRVKLEAMLEPELPLFIDGDADQLVQVLLALVINAMDATPEGARVTVRTRGERGDDGGLTAVLEVEDEGPGIPRSLQAKVFEPFFTTKPPGQGTGLGLAICYGIVTDHGGQLELASPDGPGATFRVVLPDSRLMQRRAS